MQTNIDKILETMNRLNVAYLLIGGMNFLLRHQPELTFDVDVWVRDDPVNLEKLNRALRSLEAPALRRLPARASGSGRIFGRMERGGEDGPHNPAPSGAVRAAPVLLRWSGVPW